MNDGRRDRQAFRQLPGGVTLVSGSLGSPVAPSPPDLAPRTRGVEQSNLDVVEPLVVHFVEWIRRVYPRLYMILGTFRSASEMTSAFADLGSHRYRELPRKIGIQLDGNLHDLSKFSFASIVLEVGLGGTDRYSAFVQEKSPFQFVLLFSREPVDLDEIVKMFEYASDPAGIQQLLVERFGAYLAITEETNFLLLTKNQGLAKAFVAQAGVL